jgi:hypothetical protein
MRGHPLLDQCDSAIDPFDIVINSALNALELRDITLARADKSAALTPKGTRVCFDRHILASRL